MTQPSFVYKWNCPICSRTRTGLTCSNRAAIEAQAENDIRNHVRNTNGGGHARQGELPRGFYLDPANEYVEFSSEPGTAELTNETPL